MFLTADVRDADGYPVDPTTVDFTATPTFTLTIAAKDSANVEGTATVTVVKNNNPVAVTDPLETNANAAVMVLGPILQPLTKVTADTLLDWVIEKVKNKIGELLFEQTKPTIKKYVIKPLVDRAFTSLHGLLVRKFPRVFKGTALKTQDEE